MDLNFLDFLKILTTQKEQMLIFLPFFLSLFVLFGVAKLAIKSVPERAEQIVLRTINVIGILTVTEVAIIATTVFK